MGGSIRWLTVVSGDRSSTTMRSRRTASSASARRFASGITAPVGLWNVGTTYRNAGETLAIDRVRASIRTPSGPTGTGTVHAPTARIASSAPM